MSATRTPAATASAVQGAIVFTDIAGFTEFTAVRGDEAALELLAIQERLIRLEMGEHGHIVKELGDGLMLWFEDACQAVHCALAFQEEFERRSSAEDMPLWVRIGIHYGRSLRRGSDVIGHDVNVAARIVDLAAPGEVLVSEAMAERVAEGLEGVWLEEVGPAVMKGIPDPVGVYRAVRA
jgi:adenylate cyclase